MDKFMPNYINWTIYFIFQEEQWTAAHFCVSAESTMTRITISNWLLFESFFPLHSTTYPSFCSLYSISLDYIWSNTPSYSSPKRLVCPALCIIAVLSNILVWNLIFLPPFSQLTIPHLSLPVPNLCCLFPHPFWGISSPCDQSEPRSRLINRMACRIRGCAIFNAMMPLLRKRMSSSNFL